MTAEVRDHVDDRTTKEFLLDAVRETSPAAREKSGQWYWLPGPKTYAEYRRRMDG